MSRLSTLGKRVLAYAVSASMAYTGPLQAALTDIADYPITQPASTSLNTNLLLILDDSGSMARQFSPDYVSLSAQNCFDSYDTNNDLTSSPQTCGPGDPPAMSPEFNTQYYNPEVRYLPAVDYNGAQRTNMTAANTSNWTAVPTDNVSSAAKDEARKDLHSGSNWDSGNSPVIENYDLVNQWPDRVWCALPTDSASDPAVCKTNSAYTYPNFFFGYGRDGSNNEKYKFGAPYYYRILPTEFCTDARMDDCVVSTEATVVGGKSYSVPASVRFCPDDPLGPCHSKRSVSSPDRRYPRFLGNVTANGSGATKAEGSITIATQPDSAQGNIVDIVVTKLDGTTFSLSNGRTLTAGSSTSTWAELIENEIDGNPNGLSPAFTASHSTGPTTTVFANTAGADFNGATITITTNVTGKTPAYIDFTFSGTFRDNTIPGVGEVNSLVIEGNQFVSGTIYCTHTDCNSSSSTTRNNRMASLVRGALTPPAGWTVSGSNNVVRITAPAGSTPPATGSEKNNTPAAIGTANTTASGSNGSRLGSGVTTGDVIYTTQNFSGGTDVVPPAGATRENVGTFVRTNIVPGQTYNKYADRTDCIATEGVCAYDEEMTNFANWFAYYRTRMQMAKSAIGRSIALAALPDNWRLGFMTINFGTSKYLPVAPFTTGAGAQRDQWYQKLYDAPGDVGGTPLRGALSRAGRYFANQNPGGNMGSTPINSACQPNFALLTSDGYWNTFTESGTPAAGISGSALGDADSDGSSNTLADVAHYYYNNDLSTDAGTGGTGPGAGYANQVPSSGIDTAPHQHMTTFTIGMGISGTLLFHPNYLEPGNSIDYDSITDGDSATTPNQWPAPSSGAETTVDDMWHAAVNGKGRFFSAQNPVALALGINEVLNAIAQRVGAGAAAATSNLQPIAGDNFAFTAQYSTVEWSGDLKARTIRLTDGLIAGRELWSASTQLDQRGHTDRKIYTLDPADTDATVVITVNGETRTQNANRLRSFCRQFNVLDPTCDDGGLLTDTESDDYFDPLGGASGALSHTAGWPGGDPRRTAATRGSLIRFLRGETSNEMALGGTGASDLYRNRVHLLGDIVNAQPSYVKASPFNYGAATDPFYLDFKHTTDGSAGTRKGTVYVAANDGMLHAFETDPDNSPYYQTAGIENPDTNAANDDFQGTKDEDPITGEGAERWAYIPTLVFPTLKRLAEANYSTNHRFYVDGSPQIGDACFGHTLSTPCSSAGNWKTILVGGLNQGGRGYYALDITNPDNPKGLWELKGGSGAACIVNDSDVDGTQSGDCNIGSTFGNPIIAKRPEDGKWVVIVASGYNNASPGDGKGYLYVVDAQTGKILRRMSTGTGNGATPSGLARINAWVGNALTDNTALAVYGGDLEGNLWRFQLDQSTTPSIPRYSVTKLATVYDPSGNPQPITVKPELAEIKGASVSHRAIFFGTGQFLGSSDKTDNQRQSIYAIKDAMAGAGDATPQNDVPQTDMTRTSPTTIAGFVRQALSPVGTDQRTVSTINAVNFDTNSGWFIDLPDGGAGTEAAERVNVDPVIQLGTLIIASNVPSSETCVAGGFGWVNFLDVKTGGTVPTGVSNTPASVKIAASLIVGINVVKIGDQIKTIVTTADNQQLTQETPTTPGGVEGRRVTWRELFVE